MDDYSSWLGEVLLESEVMVPDGASRGKCGKPDEFEKNPAIAICTLLVQSVLAPRKVRKSVWPIWYR